MKNIKFIFAALVSFAALSCHKESLPQDAPEANLEENKIPLILRTGDETKTSLQSDGSIHWTLGDQIAVFENNTSSAASKNEFTATYVNGSSAEFQGSVNRLTRIGVVYPLGLAESCQLSTLTDIFGTQCKFRVNVPASQTAKAGTFAEAHNISVAKASLTQSQVAEASITFKNVCALLSFTMPSSLPEGTTIKEVTLSSSVNIAGKMDIDYSGDTPQFDGLSDAVKQVTMVGDFAANKTYWFVVAPVTLDGITIAVEDSKGNVYRKSSVATIPLTQGKYRNLGTLDFDKMGEITVSAEHDFGDTDTKVLNGTNLSVRLPKSDIIEIDLTITKKDNADIVRTITDVNDVEKGIATSNYDPDGDAPYLPFGAYTLTGSYTTESGTKYTVSEEFTIEVRPEDLNVTSVSAYTSYTKYQDGKVDDANALNGDSIYLENIGGISGNILNKTYYAPYIKVKFDSGSDISATYKSAGLYEFSKLAYRQYKQAVLLFDGVESSAFTLSNCHVTGIPYTLNPEIKDSSWSESGYITWNTDGAVRIGYNLTNWTASEVASISKKFHSPTGGISVVLSSTGVVEGSRVGGANSFRISVSGEQWYLMDVSRNSTASIQCSVNNTLPSGSPEVKCINNKSTSANCSRIKTFSIIYNK